MEEVELANLDIVDKVVLLDMEIQDKHKLAILENMVAEVLAEAVAEVEVEVGDTTAAQDLREVPDKMVILDKVVVTLHQLVFTALAEMEDLLVVDGGMQVKMEVQVKLEVLEML